jgi:Holliday junction resolvasome RuvABC endonuclease subunit
MGENNLILGIDPGTTNYGWCLVDPDSLLPVRSGNSRLDLSLRSAGGDASLVSGVGLALAEHIDAAQAVGCEQQMRRKMDIVCGASLGYALGKGKRIFSVAPGTVKRRFGIKPGGSREKNKILAVARVAELIGKNRVETDHAADAYLVARYVALILKEEEQLRWLV